LSEARVVDGSDRVHVRRDAVAIDEWWRSTTGGLEQGFDVERAPEGDGALRVDLAVEGALQPELLRDEVVLRDGKGLGRVSMRGLFAKDARGRALPAWFTVEGASIAIHVDDRGAVYPVAIDPVIGTETELAPADLVAGATFGTSISLGTKRLLIGAPGESVGGSVPGAAYVFDQDATGTWAQSAKLTSTDGVTSDAVGTTVLVEGDTAFVGAPSRAGSTLTGVGAVYVFKRDTSGTWAQSQLLTPPVAVDSMSFGSALAYANSLLFIGARDETIGAASGAGAVYAFAQASGVWAYQSKLAAATPVDSDRLGSSLAATVTGTTLTVAAGAPNHQGAQPTGSGATWLFTRATTSTGAWTELTTLLASDATTAAYFGSSLAMDGASLLVGAPGHDTASFGAGVLYLYARDATKGTWSLTSEIVASDGAPQDGLGTSVGLRGGVVVAGASSAYNGTLLNAGKVYVFTPAGSAWNAREIVPTDPIDSAGFGAAIEFDGTSLVAAAPQFSSTTLTDLGAAYVFNPASGLALGGACVNTGDCTSGFCVDGVCCESACTGQCQACAATGHCQPLDGAAPNVGKPTCTFPYRLCVKGACATSCATTADCATGASCDVTNQCVAEVATGGKCAADGDCKSGHCADGYCCDTACAGTCQACDVSGKLGTCSPVTGPTHGARACATLGTDAQCGLTCDGIDTSQCKYASASTACVKQSCSGSQATNQGVCDGTGACNVAPSDCPGYLKCATATTCKSSCATSDDCIARSTCEGGTCTAPKVADCSPDH
ncbi:MAG: hypothetical protein ACHREM_28410, partial [Polyangiales bacterium]